MDFFFHDIFKTDTQTKDQQLKIFKKSQIYIAFGCYHVTAVFVTNFLKNFHRNWLFSFCLTIFPETIAVRRRLDALSETGSWVGLA